MFIFNIVIDICNYKQTLYDKYGSENKWICIKL